MNDEGIILGAYYHDVVTGFHGTATGLVRYLTGCNQVLLVPKVGGDGKLQDAQWFDVQRVVVHPDVHIIRVDNTWTPGPDKEAPKR